MPTFLHGKESEVLLNQYDITCYLNSLDITQDIDLPEVTTYCDDTRRYINGLRNATGSTSGFVDDDATAGIDKILQDTFGVSASSIWTVAPSGFTPGNIAYLFRALLSSYGTSQPVDGVISFSADLQLDGNLNRGTALKTISAVTTTADGTSADGLAATANGLIGHLHVTAASGTTPTLDVVINDSADDMTFVPVTGGTFTQVTTTPTYERIQTAAGVSVARYVRAEWAITGTTPSYTFAVAFARL